MKKNGFLEMDVDTKLILLGQVLTVIGTTLLSLGQIFKLLNKKRLYWRKYVLCYES